MVTMAENDGNSSCIQDCAHEARLSNAMSYHLCEELYEHASQVRDIVKVYIIN